MALFYRIKVLVNERRDHFVSGKGRKAWHIQAIEGRYKHTSNRRKVSFIGLLKFGERFAQV